MRLSYKVFAWCPEVFIFSFICLFFFADSSFVKSPWNISIISSICSCFHGKAHVHIFSKVFEHTHNWYGWSPCLVFQLTYSSKGLLQWDCLLLEEAYCLGCSCLDFWAGIWGPEVLMIDMCLGGAVYSCLSWVDSLGGSCLLWILDKCEGCALPVRECFCWLVCDTNQWVGRKDLRGEAGKI